MLIISFVKPGNSDNCLSSAFQSCLCFPKVRLSSYSCLLNDLNWGKPRKIKQQSWIKKNLLPMAKHVAKNLCAQCQISNANRKNRRRFGWTNDLFGIMQCCQKRFFFKHLPSLFVFDLWLKCTFNLNTLYYLVWGWSQLESM